MNRRRFFRFAVSTLSGMVLYLEPKLFAVRNVLAEVKKSILSKNTRMRDLIRRNPSTLDTRNLETTPINQFGTMGRTQYKFDKDTWRLKIRGNIRKEFSLTYDEMMKLPSTERNVLLICPGFFAQHGKWKGIDMDQFLSAAVLEGNAVQVTFSSPLSGAKSEQTFPLNLVRSNQVYLAYAVNDEPLPEKHGFPLRIVAEGAYGDQWVKFVDSVIIQ